MTAPTLQTAIPTFLGLPGVALDGIEAGCAVIAGIAEATPYEPGRSSHAAGGPDAIRRAVEKYASSIGHHDFDFGAPLSVPESRVFDLGNLACDPNTPAENRSAITALLRRILQEKALPVILGGDDSVPIPLLAAYEEEEPFWLVQVDAHIDWRDEREGVREGWSSTMRRASEMRWVKGIVQVGIRGVGSARPEDVADAERYGAKLILARTVQAHGIASVLDVLPRGARCFLTLDCDALDPSVMPAVLTPVPGGLTYWQVLELIEGLSQHGRLVGFDLVELMPERDLNGLGALMAGRIVCNLLAALARRK